MIGAPEAPVDSGFEEFGLLTTVEARALVSDGQRAGHRGWESAGDAEVDGGGLRTVLLRRLPAIGECAFIYDSAVTNVLCTARAQSTVVQHSDIARYSAMYPLGERQLPRYLSERCWDRGRGICR